MPELDGVRGLAILLVLAWHFIACQLGTGAHGLAAFAAQVSSLTWSGVNLFFVLSGFLITGILLDHRDSPKLMRVFYARRALRILPLYLILCIAFAVVLRLQPPHLGWLLDNPLPLWTYFSFTQNSAMAAADSFGAKGMSVTWSLAVEEQFYILIPLMVRLLSLKTLALTFAALVALAPLLRELIGGLGAYVLFLARADSLLLGGLLACAVRNEELLAMLRRNRRSFLFVFAFLTSGAVALSFKCQVPPLGDAFLNLWLSFLYAQVVLLPFVCPGTRLCRMLRLNALCWLGTRSYGIYILHMIAAGVLHGVLLRRPPGLYSPDSALVTLFALLLTLALAELSFRFFEAPFLRLGQRLRYAPAPARAAQPQGALVPEGTG